MGTGADQGGWARRRGSCHPAQLTGAPLGVGPVLPVFNLPEAISLLSCEISHIMYVGDLPKY